MITFLIQLFGHLIYQTGSRTRIIRSFIIIVNLPFLLLIQYLLQLFILLLLMDCIDPSLPTNIYDFLFLFSIITLFIILIMIVLFLISVCFRLLEVFRCWYHFQIRMVIIHNHYLLLTVNVSVVNRSMTIKYVYSDLWISLHPFLFKIYSTPTVYHHNWS